MSSKEDLQRGLDIARYYQDLIDHPPALVPYNQNALKILVDRCKKGVTPEEAFIAASLAGPLSSKGWENVKQEYFSFPADNGPHLNIRREWWYFACNLQIPGESKPLSVLFVIIRRGTVPAYMRRSGQEVNDAQVVFSQAYVTLPSNNKHYFSRYYTSGKNTVMTSSPFNISASNNLYMKSLGRDSVFPMNVVINDPSAGIDIQLALSTTNSPDWFPQGNGGCAPCISGLGYRYYSWPNITVHGSVNLTGQTFPSLKGVGWLDHQWGARMNPLGYLSNYYMRALNNITITSNPRINIRWNWFFFHLDNCTEITTALLPAPEASQDNKGPFDLSNTTLIDSGQKKLVKRSIKGTMEYTEFHRSPTGTLYPSGWKLRFPGEDLVLTLTPTIQDQYGYSDDNAEFIEAGVVITGKKGDKDITGTGFAECIAYQTDHDFIKNSLNTLGYSNQDISKITPEFYPVKPGGGLFALSLFIVVLPFILIALVLVFCVMLIQMNMKK